MPEALSYICPSCGSEVRVGSQCPGCAKKPPKKGKQAPKPAKKPWEQDSALDGLDLPNGEFDYDQFVEKEFGKAPHAKLGVKWYWWLLGVIVLVSLIGLAFGL